MNRLIVIAMVLSCMGGYAQEIGPRIIIPPDLARPDITEGMKVESIDMDVKIHGFLAETVSTMVFRNPNNRVLSGDLYFPLPEGATVSGYALDINGKMVDGVVVEKAKGRQVFEKIVRQGIDPGLIEYTKGNVFKTRVFPLPAQGTRTIRVRFVSELLPNVRAAQYAIPLHYGDKVSQFHLRVEVIQSELKPEIQSGGLEAFQFAAWNNSFVAETTLTDQALNQNLVIALPEGAKRMSVLEHNENGNTYFVLADQPETPALQAASPPSRVTILWDASGSRGNEHRAKEIALLKSFFAGFPDRKIAVEVVLFRNDRETLRGLTVENGDSTALTSALESVAYDGGTQWASISPGKEDATPDFYLLFSDGMGNFGSSHPEGFTKPVYTFSADPITEHPALRDLAQRTGGEYFNLCKLTEAEVLPRIGQTGLSLMRVEVLDGETAEITPSGRTGLIGRLLITGKLLSDSATIVLHHGMGSTETEASAPIILRKADAVGGDRLRLFWAQEKLDELLMDPKENAKAITALGRLHGLVTPGTSLIVLDSLEQYVQNEIRPPASLAEIRQQYDQWAAQKNKEKGEGQESKIERVLALWKARVQWWEKKFDPQKGLTFKKHGERLLENVAMDGAMRTQETAFDFAPSEAAPAPAMPEPTGAIDADGIKSLSALGYLGESKKAEAKADVSPEPAEIQIKKWDPQAPYLDAIKAADGPARYAAYLGQKKEYGTSPAFFLDCADYFREQKEEGQSVRILSNLAEIKLEDAAVLRVLAHRLAQLKQYDLSIGFFEQVLDLRGEEPQSYRNLALVLAKRAEADCKSGTANTERVKADFARAIELLYHVVLTPWDRFIGIEVTALTELNRLIPMAKASGLSEIAVDSRLIQPLTLDIRIVMTWDTDLTDMDLWVTEPTGEKAYYGHNLTGIGGMVSTDFTQGYGPEEYLLRRAMKGPYKIETNFFGSQAMEVLGATTLQVDVYTHYGQPDEQCQSITLRLKEQKESITVGEIRY